MLKRSIIRLLLFGIPFGLSYWATRPTAPVSSGPPQPFVVCAYPGDKPGELRIRLDTSDCAEGRAPGKIRGGSPVSVFPAVTTLEASTEVNGGEALNNVSF